MIKNIYKIAFFFLLSCIFTFPLILNLSAQLPGPPNDAYVYLWNIFNFWEQLRNSENIFYSQMVMFPLGANLFFHTYAPLISIFGYLFLKHLPLYTNILILLSVTFSAFFTELLVYKITKNKMAGFVAGIIYAFAPITWSFIWSQHYYFLYSAFFYPLMFNLIFSYFNTGKKRYFLKMLLIFWLVIGIDYYSAVLYSLTSLIFFSAMFFHFKNFKRIPFFIISFFTIIIIPFISLFLTNNFFQEFIKYRQTHNSSGSCNTNLNNFLNPSVQGIFIKNKIGDYNPDTPSYFLGWGIFGLFLISVYKNRKNKLTKPFVFVFLIIFILSLGTNIKYKDVEILSGLFTPFYYFMKIPILGSIDCPIRFPIIMQLIISIFIGMLISKTNIKKQKLLTIFIIILVIFEYSNHNRDFSDVNIPYIYHQLSEIQDKRTLLEIPSGISESKSAYGYDWSIQALHSKQMYWQTIHKKPRIGVYMSRLTPKEYYYFREESVISDIFNLSSINGVYNDQINSNEKILEFIKKFNLGYIILSPNPRQKIFEEYIDQNFGFVISDKQKSEEFIFYILKNNHL